MYWPNFRYRAQEDGWRHCPRRRMASWVPPEMASKEAPPCLSRCGVTLAKPSAELDRRSASAYCPLLHGNIKAWGPSRPPDWCKAAQRPPSQRCRAAVMPTAVVSSCVLVLLKPVSVDGWKTRVQVRSGEATRPEAGRWTSFLLILQQTA